ncbi:MAG: glutamate racemase [Lagierella massiliensis]|nr:glutamate racemase [Lagierella massiliensis]
MKSKAIGIFDSGYGGLTFLKEILKFAPNGNYIYFGDNIRIPYGDKSKDEIIKYTKNAIDFFLKKDVKAVVIACNTVSTHALEELKDKVNVPLIGIGEVGAKGAVRETINKKVLVLATKSTISGKLYDKCINKLDNEVIIKGISCPKLVPIIESNVDEIKKTDRILKALEEYKKQIQGFDYDTIVLGCTHYPYIKNEIQLVFGKDNKIVNPSYELAKMVLEIFPEERTRKVGHLEIYTSGNVDEFRNFASSYLNRSDLKIHNFNF